MQVFRFYRNRVQKVCSQLKRDFFRQSLENLKSSDPSKWWKGMNSLMGRSSGNDHLTKLANEHCDGNIQQLSEDINHQFTSVCKDIPALNYESLLSNISNNDFEAKYVISVEAVEKALSNTVKINLVARMTFQIGF